MNLLYHAAMINNDKLPKIIPDKCVSPLLKEGFVDSFEEVKLTQILMHSIARNSFSSSLVQVKEQAAHRLLIPFVAVRDFESGDFLVARFKLPEASMYGFYSIGLQGCLLEGEQPHDAVYRMLSDDMDIKENDTILPRFHGFLTTSDSPYERACLVLFYMVYTLSNHFQSKDNARLVSKWMSGECVKKLYDGGFHDPWSTIIYPHLIQHCSYEYVKKGTAM